MSANESIFPPPIIRTSEQVIKAPQQEGPLRANRENRLPVDDMASSQRRGARSTKASSVSMDRDRDQNRKRKAGPPVDQPPAHRHRFNQRSNGALKDEAHVHENFKVPQPADYPSLSPLLFRKPKEYIHNKLQRFARVQSSFRNIDRSAVHCALRCVFKDGADPIENIEGEGLNRRAAEQAAYSHLLAHIHQAGMMLDLFGSAKDFQLDRNTLAAEADAKMDIYNYAARFDCLPTIEINHEQKRRAVGKARQVVSATVTLPEQSISVIGRGLDVRSAEIAAAIKFKEAAERFHAQHGSESIIIKDTNSLTTANARQFFDFYKIIHPDSRFELATEALKGSRISGGLTEARAVLNGTLVGSAVQMSSKKRAEDLAYLTAAIAIKKQEPSVYPRFLKAFKAGNGQILKPLAPATLLVERDCLLAMQDTLLSARDAGLPDEVRDIQSDEDKPEARRGGFGRRALEPSEVQSRNTLLQQKFVEYLENPSLTDLRKRRSDLPMNQYLTQVLGQVEQNMYSIIIGATGSGKTTQVPQILLERAISEGEGATCNIICTQPRRIAATSVARRVAEERNENLRDTVGYHVRFDSKIPTYGGGITYCTTGILLQQLQNSPDEVMDRISHLVIDEVHERDILIDFLMIILKKVIAQRLADSKTVPKVVLMSATMDSDLFASYFGSTSGSAEPLPCPTLSVPGRTFPVKERFLEDIMGELTTQYTPAQLSHLKHDRDTRDYTEAEEKFANDNSQNVKRDTDNVSQPEDFAIDWKQERKITSAGTTVTVNEKEEALVPHSLVAAIVAHVIKTTTEGAILVFLPGLDEIVKVNELLTRGPILGTNLNDSSKYKFYLLHSSMPAGQTEVFEPPPPGTRKIILATNIAETSITIPDVQHVIDSGKHREKRYDQARRITQLQCTWISKSNSKQRAGRAGRVQNGNYYALFSNARYQMSRAIGLPEMLRTDLQEICLDIKAQAFKSPVREFLASAIEPPAPEAVDASVNHLIDLDAFTEEENITPLGRLLAALPVHPSLGKMIVLGVMFRCLDPMIVLGAAAAERSLFVQPLEAKRESRQAKLSFVKGSGSDHITLLNAIRELRIIKEEHSEYDMRRYCMDNFIHINAYRTIESTGKQIEDILVESKLIPRISPFERQQYQFGDRTLNENSHSVPFIKALLLAGTHPNLAASTGPRTFRTPGEKNVVLHPGSVNAVGDKGFGARTNPNANHFIYSVLARANDGNSMMLRDSTEVTPLMATLFGGKARLDRNIIELDDWLPFYVRSVDRRAARIIVEFRKALERLYAETFTDLATKRKGREHDDRGRKSYLADEEVRSIFASGLVEIFAQDISPNESIGNGGYGMDRYRR